MKPYLVLYASKHGQTRRIAERMFAELQRRGQCASLCDLDKVAHKLGYAPLLSNYGGAVLVGPLHAGHYPRSLCKFVRAYRDELTALGATLASVSLSATILQQPERTAEEKNETASALSQCVSALARSTGFTPAAVLHLAGALMYTEYDPFTRWLMKQIAKKQGASTDTTRNHEFTDWGAVSAWADGVCERARSLRSSVSRESQRPASIPQLRLA